MKNKLSYTEAFAKLEALVAELEDGNVMVDKLTDKVNQANELIDICENKLRKTETAVGLAMGNPEAGTS